jgi:DNA-binding NarL/FixJ family response regulator
MPADAPKPRLIAIADSSPAFLAAAANYVAGMPGYALAGTAASTADAVDMVEAVAPQILLLDLGSAPARGLNAIRQVKSLPNAPAVIALALFYSDEIAIEARTAGADALIGKAAFVSGLAKALSGLAPPLGQLSQRP